MSNDSLSLLANLLAKASSDPKLIRALLEDILTPAEIADLAQRWRIVQALYAGTPQRDIAETLHVSLSKVTRGSRMLLNKRGGFNQIMSKPKKLDEKATGLSIHPAINKNLLTSRRERTRSRRVG